MRVGLTIIKRYYSIVWSGATKMDLGKLQLAQNRAAWLALKCTQRDNINDTHGSEWRRE
jgi:hypothetical protein